MAIKKDSQKQNDKKINYGHIIDSNRDINDLYISKLTPQTIKMLYGSMHLRDDDYKKLTQYYSDEQEKNNLKRGGIKKNDVIYKGNRTWEQVRARSAYIDPKLYKVEKTEEFEGVIDTVENIYKKREKELNSMKHQEIKVEGSSIENQELKFNKENKKDKILKIAQQKLKRNSELTQIIENKLQTMQENENRFDLHQSHGSGGYDNVSINNTINLDEEILDSQKIIKKNISPKKVYRKHEDEEVNIMPDRRPVLSQQVQKLKEQNLSLVDFNILPDEILEVEETQNTILIRLIQNINKEVSYREFAAPAPRPEKPKEFEIIRKTNYKYEDSDLLEIKKDIKNIDKLVGVLPASDIHRLNEINEEIQRKKNKRKNNTNDGEGIKFNWNYTPSKNAKVSMEKYKNTNYNYRFDTNKKPTLRENKTYEKQMIYYLEQVKKQHDSGYNRQVSIELKNFNNIINSMSNVKANTEELNLKMDSNRKHAIVYLKKHIELNEHKEELELKLLKKQLVNKGKIANLEKFMKSLPEFQKILGIRDHIKDNRTLLINCLQKLISLTEEIKSNLKNPKIKK
ncbi:hypothetical protein [Spiroplasma endosymbiont of Amphibalanus improvisus]|uniref:hypothetical protein n=1 Tax=Spiroplasma endosymbiont of Amphibalanus improvisus TaxID=3066327 RepID=UPI00313AF805